MARKHLRQRIQRLSVARGGAHSHADQQFREQLRLLPQAALDEGADLAVKAVAAQGRATQHHPTDAMEQQRLHDSAQTATAALIAWARRNALDIDIVHEDHA